MLIILVLFILTFTAFSVICKEGFTDFFLKIAMIDLLIFGFWLGTSLNEPQWFFPKEETSTETAQLIKLSQQKIGQDIEIIYSAEKTPRYFEICYKRKGAALHTDKSFLIENKNIFISSNPEIKEATFQIIEKSKKARLSWWFFPSLPISEKTFYVALPKR